MKRISVVFLLIFLVGCFPEGKIKLGIDYQDISGSIEYDLNANKTAQNGVPTYESEQGQEVYIIGEKDIESILQAIEGAGIKKTMEKKGKAIEKLRVYLWKGK